VFGFLSDLGNHWRLEGRFVQLGGLDADGLGGRVKVKGPLGLSRTARTRVLGVEPESRLNGRAEIGSRTVGLVEWTIAPLGAGSQVTLTARVERASALDRAVLALGGRAWLGRIFVRALARLDEVLDQHRFRSSPSSPTTSPTARPSAGCSVVEVDPDREQLGSHRADDRAVQPVADPALTLARVVVSEQVRGPRAPASGGEHAHAGARDDVADVARLAPVLGDDPERPSVEPVPDRGAARLAARAPCRLEHGPAPDEAERHRPLHEGIDRVPAERRREAALV
jgi:hypothetical protein